MHVGKCSIPTAMTPSSRFASGVRFASGFALAATIAKDRGAERARAGLHDAVADAWTQLAREISGLEKRERRARVREWMTPRGCTWPSAAQALRACALIARRGPPHSAVPSWLHAAPLPRAGYTPEPQLISLLERIALASWESVPGTHTGTAADTLTPNKPAGTAWGA